MLLDLNTRRSCFVDVLNNVLSIDYFKKLINLQIVHYSLAWLGVYMLGYYNFSIGWMVTPLLLR